MNQLLILGFLLIATYDSHANNQFKREQRELQKSWQNVHAVLVQGFSRKDETSFANPSFYADIHFAYESLLKLGTPKEQVQVVSPDVDDYPKDAVDPFAKSDFKLSFLHSIISLRKQIKDKENAVVLFVISTHGNEGVIAYSGDRILVTATEFRNLLNQPDLKHKKTVVVLYSCHAGSFRKSLSNVNQVLLAASRPNREGHSWWQPGRGLYNPMVWNFFYSLLYWQNPASRQAYEGIAEPDFEGALRYAKKMIPISYLFYGNDYKLDRGRGVFDLEINPQNEDPTFHIQREVKLGDLDGSGSIEQFEIDFVRRVLEGSDQPTNLESFALDLNQDGLVTSEDYNEMQRLSQAQATAKAKKKKAPKLTLAIVPREGISRRVVLGL